MARNDLAKKLTIIQSSKRHSRNFHSNVSAYLNYRLRKNARDKKIALNQYEKVVIAIGVVVILLMMVSLISLKVTSGSYQQDISRFSSKVSRVKTTNDNLHQEIVGLQKGSRLRRIAHQDHLRMSEKNVRNVR